MKTISTPRDLLISELKEDGETDKLLTQIASGIKIGVSATEADEKKS